METGKLIILSAPSGAGKSSLAKALTERLPNTVVAISHTTRATRPGEEQGTHYFFVDQDTFQAMIKSGQFLEYAKVFDYYYGTSRVAIEESLRLGKNVLLDIDWQGARAIKSQMPQAVSIFILPPTRATLEQRLRDRGQDSPEAIARRMRDALAEMRHYEEFDYTVINDEFSAALADLMAIINGRPESRRTPRVDVEGFFGQE